MVNSLAEARLAAILFLTVLDIRDHNRAESGRPAAVRTSIRDRWKEAHTVDRRLIRSNHERA